VGKQLVHLGRPPNIGIAQRIAPVADLADFLGFDELSGAMLERRLGGLQILFALASARDFVSSRTAFFVKDRPIGRFEGPQCAIEDS